MNEKTSKIKLPKYSSYLTDNDARLLDSFCTQFDCSKAKALPLLLKFWSDNKNNVSNELATISSEDISAKKYDNRLATLEDKLATISYDTELATIKERLATLENMLATIPNDELATISNELAIEDKEDITVDSTLSESPILPLNEVSAQIVPETEKKANTGDIVSKEQISELLKKHNLNFLGEIKNLALLHPFLTELNELQGKKATIKGDNISKVAKHDSNFLMPTTLWLFLSVKKHGNRWIWTRI